jgi:multiple antibiotic resistance protein
VSFAAPVHRHRVRPSDRPRRRGGRAPDRARGHRGISLETPIIAGPGAITTVVVQATEAANGVLQTGLLLLALAAVMLLTFVAFLVAGRIERLLGATGMNVVSRILGILLAAVSAEMILAGLKQSGVFVR